ncbi:hypothetical protein PF010_g17413 [Phytophthora fragariae]|uniref:Uncharacterized protein n=1 Tax=Phytophthora fragariae TaxID=53985 RepID=A0A6A3ITP3_9STRA|nr:hypothetical protein PF011_g21048 [Phytophthora fragariae]KAE9093626.1 hypothetical protein PF010_g17413 [Phytophthora fragariae]KAE9206260.1 hypothetical protein PF004_g17349 [Phytophthora fragariae]
MIANLVDDAQLHPTQLDVETKASEAKLLAGAAQEDKIQAVADIDVAQRKKSVKASVPYTMWVRPAHVKGVAMHVRESIYVLDVQEDNSTQLQLYAYQDIELPSGDTIESGTVTEMNNLDGIRLLQELIRAGIHPLVLIVKWQKKGNHFQAVTYDRERYEYYADHMAELVTIRNEILVSFGGLAMDAVPYDTSMTANAVKKELVAIRKAVKTLQREQPAAVQQPVQGTVALPKEEADRQSRSSHTGSSVEGNT